MAQCQQSEQAAGLAFLSAVGEIPVKMTRRAEAWVVDRADTGRAELGLDAGPQIHLVMTRADARADDGNAVGGPGAEGLCHDGNQGGDDVGEGAAFAAVGETDGRSARVHDEDGGAIGAADE